MLLFRLFYGWIIFCDPKLMCHHDTLQKPSVSAYCRSVCLCFILFLLPSFICDRSWLYAHLCNRWYRRVHLKQKHCHFAGPILYVFTFVLCSFPAVHTIMLYFSTECASTHKSFLGHLFGMMSWTVYSSLIICPLVLIFCLVYSSFSHLLSSVISRFPGLRSTLAASTKLLYSLGKEAKMWVCKKVPSICCVTAISLIWICCSWSDVIQSTTFCLVLSVET